jgi:hypothetical protein
MTKEEIIEIARHADREWDCDRDMFEWLETFAKTVAEKEREECAKVCENVVSNEGNVQSKWCVDSIRARGQE